MDHYYVNNQAQPTGEHEVHKKDCPYLPQDRTYVGYYLTCHEAIRDAKKHYLNVDGCAICSPNCHNR